jgi:hypothetical protein
MLFAARYRILLENENRCFYLQRKRYFRSRITFDRTVMIAIIFVYNTRCGLRLKSFSEYFKSPEKGFKLT